MGNITGLKKGLLQLVLLGILLQFCTLIGPLYLQWIVDEAIVTADRNLITVLGIGFLLLVFLRTAIEAIRSWLTTILSTQLNFQWAGNVFSHVLKLPLEWFQRRHLGDITSRFNSIQEIQDGLTTKIVTGILDGLLVISTFLMMFLYSTGLTIISFLAILLYAGLRWLAFKKQRYAASEFIINRANQESFFLESMRGIQSIRLYGNEGYRHIGWINLLAKEFNANLILERLSISFQAANTLLFNAERIIIIWLAASLILNNEFSVGMLLAFMSYKEQLSERIVSLIDNLCTIAMLKLHVERLADVVFSPPEKNLSSPEAFHYDINILTTQIELRNVYFRYSDYEPFILENINLTIPANQSVAITGPSGCGKTTLLKLLLGLLTPTAGEILIGNIPLTRLNLTSFRTIIGSVMQDDLLFSGSVADNICFYSAEPDQERIESCAAMAVIHDEILAMPMGYNTLIGDIGSGLSGGQKQRVLLARALYRQPKILALDEATSHLDTRNEQAVNSIISKFNLTRLIVAHRKETIMMADRVLRIEKANIISDYYNHSTNQQQ
ncbi:peptidase domain-containing ABC transporter [Mixta theicola]